MSSNQNTRRSISRRTALKSGCALSAGLLSAGCTMLSNPAAAHVISDLNGDWTAADITSEDGDELVAEVLVGLEGTVELSWEEFVPNREYPVGFTLEAKLAEPGLETGSDEYQPVATSGSNNGASISAASGTKTFAFFDGGAVEAADDSRFNTDVGNRDAGVDIITQHPTITQDDFNPENPDPGEEVTEETAVDLRLTVWVEAHDSDEVLEELTDTASFVVSVTRDTEPPEEGDTSLSILSGSAGTAYTGVSEE